MSVYYPRSLLIMVGVCDAFWAICILVVLEAGEGPKWLAIKFVSAKLGDFCGSPKNVWHLLLFLPRCWAGLKAIVRLLSSVVALNFQWKTAVFVRSRFSFSQRPVLLLLWRWKDRLAASCALPPCTLLFWKGNCVSLCQDTASRRNSTLLTALVSCAGFVKCLEDDECKFPRSCRKCGLDF